MTASSGCSTSRPSRSSPRIKAPGHLYDAAPDDSPDTLFTLSDINRLAVYEIKD